MNIAEFRDTAFCGVAEFFLGCNYFGVFKRKDHQRYDIQSPPLFRQIHLLL